MGNVISMAKLDGGNVVTDVIKADDADPVAGYVECPEGTGIGYTHDPGADTWAPPAVVPPTPDEATYAAWAQRHLDVRAQSMGYDSIFTAVSYAGETAVPTFDAQGTALRAWRSNVWAYCYQMLADVQAETRQPPADEAALKAELDTNVPYTGPI